MGKSKAIKSAEQLNAEFQAYLLEIQKSLKDRAKTQTEEFSYKVEEFYKSSNFDKYMIMSGESIDFRQMHEFNLDQISAAIKSITDTVFTGKSKGEGTTEQTQEKVKTILDYKELAIKTATGVVMAALDAFKLSTNITYETHYVAESICPGLTLHLLISTDSYHRGGIFNNDVIIETVLNYQLVFSYGKGQTEMDISYLDKRINYILSLTNKLTDMEEKISNYMMDPSIPLETVDAYVKRAKMLSDMLEKARQEIEDLKNRRVSASSPTLVTLKSLPPRINTTYAKSK